MSLNRWSIIAICLFALASPGRSQSEATAQAEKGLAKAATELDAVYQTVLKRIDHPKLKEDVQAAQRAWIAYRDREAVVRAGVSSQGGSAYSMDLLATCAELTQERTLQLQNSSSDYESPAPSSINSPSRGWIQTARPGRRTAQEQSHCPRIDRKNRG